LAAYNSSGGGDKAVYKLIKNGQPGGRVSSSDEDEEDASQSDSPSDDDEVSGSDAEDTVPTVPKGKEAAQVSDEDTDADSPSDDEEVTASSTTSTVEEPPTIARLSEEEKKAKKAQRKFELDSLRRTQRRAKGKGSREEEWDEVNKLFPGGTKRYAPVEGAAPTKSILKSGSGTTAQSTQGTTPTAKSSQTSSTQGRRSIGSTRTSR